MALRRLYHVTPSRNVAAILRDGIDPAKARGRHRSSWLVAGPRVPWAIIHIRRRHKCRDVTVLIVYIESARLIRFSAGVYRTNQVTTTIERL